ncbi:glycosyltransferase family 2 protein [Aquimarina sp. ERC-38]|uniref:dolichyl-phosphate beta-glucosyltransferase n=1 Tax=Aquimarina sp. ERC-38 TaxID=2949996 RepID=UPI0022473E62|nr:dolichyl-phosphate beta-glucosyltransferase [Aquimarina sp. ERC-38]UZO82270.1 glycosyltransferase family 2 protein [Aquimarina sp. ERC-38]
MKTGIIIPCYNEEKRLDRNAFQSFIKAHKNYHLCFVNDGSQDQTLEVLKEIQTTNSNQISVVNMKRNGGKAEAVRVGANYLHHKVDTEFIGFMDADLSTDFNDFKGLVHTLQTNSKLDLVFGSRAKEGTGTIEKDGFRQIISYVINLLIVFIIGLAIKDTQCGAKVFRANLVPVLFKKQFVSKWLFDVEMFIRLKNHLGKANTVKAIYEQPLLRWVHMEDSKLGLKDSLEIPLRLAAIWYTYAIKDVVLTDVGHTFEEPQFEVTNHSVTAVAA